MILHLEEVTKNYSDNAIALREISLEITQGEFTALAGPSGSGKTTILNLAAGLDQPCGGKITLLGHDLSRLNPLEMSHLRRDKVGFIFQNYNLFPVLTAIENVEYPLALKYVAPSERRKLAQRALEETGCGELGNRLPSQLSGGQQQRIAIARAIVTAPSVVFADEPTANLDSETAQRLLLLFKELNASKNITFLFSSHDPMVLNIAGRVIQVSDGQIKSDTATLAKVLPMRPEPSVAAQLTAFASRTQRA